jgi:hypothetical protein
MNRTSLFLILFVLTIGCKTSKNNFNKTPSHTVNNGTKESLEIKQDVEVSDEEAKYPTKDGYTFNIFFDAKEEFSINNRSRIKEIQKTLEENIFEKIELYGFTYRKNDLKKSKERIDKIHELLMTKKLSNAKIEKYPKGNAIQKYHSTKDDRVEIRMIIKK